jgi:hypothetical protein
LGRALGCAGDGLSMDDETPEMEAISSAMREIMRAWIADPDNALLKERYTQLQAEYQRAFLALKQSGVESQPGGAEATHQAY